MLSSIQLLEMIKSNEEDYFDLKRKLHNVADKEELAELVRDMIAIANSAYERGFPEGYLIFGIEDKTKVCFGVEGQRLVLKDKDLTKNDMETQIKLNEFNQKQFGWIAKKYISGYPTNPLRVNYAIFEYPESENHIIGVLTITSQHAPYSVLQEIPKLGPDGKVIGNDIEIHQAWIRDGEAKRPMSPSEILAMRDEKKQKIRQQKKEDKLKLKLGEIFSSWAIDSLTLDRQIETSTGILPKTPLRTRDELNTHFKSYKLLTDQLLFLQDNDWYLNHMIVGGQSSNGKTTLINYLVNLRGDHQGLSTPILVQKIPQEPKLDDFLEYFHIVKKEKLGENDKRIIVIDLNRRNIPDAIYFIKQIMDQFKYFYIWVTCNEKELASLFDVLAANKKQKTPYKIFLDFLDKDRNDFTNLLAGYFAGDLFVNQIKIQKNISFGDLVEYHNLWRLGKFPQPDTKPTESINALFNTLDIYEKLLLKICSIIGGLDETLLNTLVSVFGLPFDTIEKIIRMGLFGHVVKKNKVQLLPSELIDINKLTVNDLEIKLLIDALNKVEIHKYGSLNCWSLADLTGTIQLCTKNEKLSTDLNRTKYRLKGSLYCHVCDEYYGNSMKACPSCGTTKNYSFTKVDQSDLFLPFPNTEQLSKGTFRTARGIDPLKSKLIIETIPTFKNDV